MRFHFRNWIAALIAAGLLLVGTLLGAGTAAADIPGIIGQASEGIDTTPLLADAIAASGVHGEALEGLAKLIRGEVACEDWVAGLRSAERARQAA